MTVWLPFAPAPRSRRRAQLALLALAVLCNLMYGAVGLVIMQVLSRRGLELLPRLTPALLVVSFLLLSR